MEIFEILDRFELLHNNEKFSDLRRAYIDQDLPSIFKLCNKEELRKAVLEKNAHSIFRIVENKRCVGELEDLRKAMLENNLHSLFRLLPGNEDLRKAVTENNIHSIFRLLDNEDLKKLILDDNVWSMFRLLEDNTETYFVKALKDLITNNIEFDKDCFSRGQLKSKIWLVDTLKSLNVELGTVFLCAGWYATLATMLFESKLQIDKIVSFDIDPDVWQIAETFNKKWVLDDWRFKASTQDIFEIMFDEHIYDVNKLDGTTETLWGYPNTVINTSTEHIENFQEWYDYILQDQLIILQGNDYFEVEEHVNCSKDLQEFSNKAPMSKVLYQGELQLSQYKRFMKIGYK
jgi:hypothetical protein